MTPTSRNGLEHCWNGTPSYVWCASSSLGNDQEHGRCSKCEAYETWFIPIFPKVSFNIIYRYRLHYIILCHIIFYYVRLTYTILYYILLDCIISYHIILFFTILNILSYIRIEYNIVWLYHRSCEIKTGYFFAKRNTWCRTMPFGTAWSFLELVAQPVVAWYRKILRSPWISTCPNCLSFQSYPSIKHW